MRASRAIIPDMGKLIPLDAIMRITNCTMATMVHKLGPPDHVHWGRKYWHSAKVAALLSDDDRVRKASGIGDWCDDSDRLANEIVSALCKNIDDPSQSTS